MKLTENPALARQIIELLEQEYKLEKPLPHLTELVYCLTRSYYDRIDPLPANEREILLFALGWGLERLLLKQQRKAEPGIVEGIHYTPDFLAFTDLPGELKTTRMSSGKFSAETMPVTWKRQILGYMKCMEVIGFELAVLFITGDYKPPFPQGKGYRASADAGEVEANWEWLLERKVIYMNCIEQKLIPFPRMFAEEWECKHCRYAVRCEVKGENKV